MKLRYTPKGASEFDAVLTYIAQHSPAGAGKVQARICLIINLLLQHPYAGKATSNRRLRRIATSPYPYLVFYEVGDDALIIHAIRHMARDPATMP